MNYTVKQISELLGLTKEQVRRLIRGGKLNATKHSRKEGYVVTQENLDAFVNGAGSKYRDRIRTEQTIVTKLTELHYNTAILLSLGRLFKLRRELSSVQQEIDNELNFLHNLTKKDS